MGRRKRKSSESGDSWGSGLEQDLAADIDLDADDGGADPAADAPVSSHPLDLSGIPTLESVEDALGRIAALTQERDEAVAARQRALADLVNFQRRSIENERRAQERGTGDVVRSLVNVLDNFDLALGQDPGSLTVESLLDGVKIVREQFTKALQDHGVERLVPQPGDEFDPNVHQAMMRQPTNEVLPDHVLTVLQPGYTMGAVVLRPAMVIVAEEAPDAGAGDDLDVDDEPGDVDAS